MRILFVCVENAGRSQMAEGFAKAFAPAGVEIASAGSQPAHALNPLAVEVMREKGIDISAARPKGFPALPKEPFDLAIGMGCGDARLPDGQACPVAKAKQVISWEIPDPKGQSLEALRQIRDEIETKVRTLMEEIKPHGSENSR